MLGSSPLARGLRGERGVGLAGRRIIPARAGFTPVRPRGGDRGGDHPRSRGVYLMRSKQRLIQNGSSPLARGLPQIEYEPLLTGRIIPARAGFTLRLLLRRLKFRDHPRSRGVYSRYCVGLNERFGSSPLARGLRLAFGDVGAEPGIIPARAGFTPQHSTSSSQHSDHPRSRGVYVMRSPGRTSHLGSSPLARGLQS